MQTPTVKVKAHSLRDNTVSDPLAYKLGNDVADHVAKHAVAHLCAPYVQQMQHRLSQQEADRKLLSQQFALRTALSQLRTQLLKQADITDTWNPDQVADNFINLEVTSPMPFPLPTDRWEAVHASRYGTEFSELVLHWLQTLVWPTAAEPGRAPVGITLFELAINFLITSQRAILIPVDGCYIDVDRSNEWSRSQCDITRWAQTLHHCIKHMEFLTQTTLLPATYGSHVSSLYRLGGGVYKHGYNRRPQMRRQTETVRCVVEYLQSHLVNGKAIFSAVPVIPQLDPVFEACIPQPAENTRKAREARYHKLRQSIKANGMRS
eukprot:Skav224264  [mRNA]  locus=scaffold2636:201124:202086:- [translate_table: standard]